ncbi:MAG: NFACT family protein [Clostridia bacterium]|nr:NFACT family protein [Clostridia bacterium]
MAIDGLFLHCMKNELSAFALGARVDKIYMPTRFELVIALRSRAGGKKLFISAGGNYPRVNFTDFTPENPASPPMLCMYLRKVLSGAMLKAIRQEGLDRILYFDFDAINEIGDKVERTLVVEVMAQYSNVILTDGQGIIMDALKRIDASRSSYREILPQRAYTLPPAQDKLNILETDTETLLARIAQNADRALSSALLRSLSGVSPLTAKELAYRVTLGDPEVRELPDAVKARLASELDALRETLLTNEISPCYTTDENGNLLDFSFQPLTHMQSYAKLNRCGFLSELLDRFCVEGERVARTKMQADDLFKTVSNLVERTAKKIAVRREELLTDGEIEKKRVAAELINVNISNLPKGVSFYEVENYYDENRPIRIPASPELSPAKNAQKYYKEYKKAQTAKKVLAEQIEKGELELVYLQTVQDELTRARSSAEIAEIREELTETGFMRRKNTGKVKKPSVQPPLTFVSPNGLKVLVGRNNLQNDRLSLHTAKKNDLWFHVQKAPGSHVVLASADVAPKESDIEFAAGLAVWFSSQRERGVAEVDYTEAKYLKKPPASNPGYVIYHVYQSVYAKAVKPDHLQEV